MNFENIRPTAKDYEKYIKPYEEVRGIKFSLVESMTIDKATSCMLVKTHTVRQDMYEGNYSITYWLFLWEGNYITYVQHKPLGGKFADKYYRVTNIIKEINMPDSIESRKHEMFDALKQAMEKNRGVGVFGADDIKVYEITLDISEVV